MLAQKVSDPGGPPAQRWLPDAGGLDRALCGVIGALVLAHLIADAAAVMGTPIRPLKVSQAFSLNAEQGVGTWFASVQLAVAATLAALTARMSTPGSTSRWWWLLATLLCAASIEEIVGLHEHLSHALGVEALREQISYTWVVVGAPVAALLGLVFLGFICRQVPVLRNRLLAGGVCFVTGAVLMELIGGIYLANAEMDLWYVLTVAAEEGFELIGGGLVLSGLYRGLYAFRRQ